MLLFPQDILWINPREEKTKILSVMIVTVALALAGGCGKKDEKSEGKDKTTKPTGGKKGETPKPPKTASVEVSPAMTAFMSDLKGKSDDVEAALKVHGVEGLDTKDMEMYDLSSPKVVKSDKDCFTFEAKSGATVRTYVVCWKDGKIATVEDKGMK